MSSINRNVQQAERIKVGQVNFAAAAVLLYLCLMSVRIQCPGTMANLNAVLSAGSPTIGPEN